MKTINLLLLLAVGLLVACTSQDQGNIDTSSAVVVEEWPDLLKRIDLSSGVVLVPKGASLQEAIQGAMPGEAIVVAAGNYKGPLDSGGRKIELIGLPGLGGKNVKIKQTEHIQLNYLRKIQKEKADPQFSIQYTDLGEGIVHYIITLPLGPDTYDVVRIHRVVKEDKPHVPATCSGNIFMVHGAVQDFDDIFLTAGAEEINASTSAPYYLASKGIDVWGVDLAWNLVPLECEDFGFMEGWGVDRDIDHTLKAMSVARLIRGLSGQGFGQMNLLGFSYGVSMCYGAAGLETQQNPICRDIAGIIPVDSEFKLGPDLEGPRMESCAGADQALQDLQAGIFVFPWGTQFQGLAGLVMNDPQGPSPIPDFAGMNNTQALLAVATMTSPNWHFLGGSLEGLLYTDFDRFLRLCMAITPYMPKQSVYDMNACACGADGQEVAFDDHLGDISLPIFYLAAGGGSPEGDWAARELTASDDVSSHIVRIEGAEQPTDYGHADLWMGKDAAELVWAHLYDWLKAH